MKRRLLFLLSLILVSTSILTPFKISAADMQSATVGIPVLTNLIGSNNSAKIYYLDLPYGVNSSSITASSLKYNGTNTLIGSITLENGKIKLTLKGNTTTTTMTNVQGFWGDFQNPYYTTPANSIWRYSDGKRWQINDYNYKQEMMESYDVNEDDGCYPSQNPPLRAVTTKSNIRTEGLVWYNNSSEVKIDPESIIPSTVKVMEYSSQTKKRSASIKTVSFVDQRAIIN